VSAHLVLAQVLNAKPGAVSAMVPVGCLCGAVNQRRPREYWRDGAMRNGSNSFDDLGGGRFRSTGLCEDVKAVCSHRKHACENCRVRVPDAVAAEFKGDKAKLIWSVSLDGKKKESETYRIIGVLSKIPARPEGAQK
jgi:hypothetical protein